VISFAWLSSIYPRGSQVLGRDLGWRTRTGGMEDLDWWDGGLVGVDEDLYSHQVNPPPPAQAAFFCRLCPLGQAGSSS